MGIDAAFSSATPRWRLMRAESARICPVLRLPLKARRARDAERRRPPLQLERVCYFSFVNKGESTREAIIDGGLTLALKVGLEGVSLGVLANRLDLSKSGLFAHFKSKEALQLAIVEEAIDRFKNVVVAPALRRPAGLARLREYFIRYLDWIKGRHGPGGCPFAVFVQEFDDRPGPIRAALVASQREWRSALGKAAADAVRAGEMTTARDGAQVAFELVGVALSYQVSLKLLDEPSARQRALRAFDRLVEA